MTLLKRDRKQRSTSTRSAIGRGLEQLEHRCLLAADSPLVVQSIDLAQNTTTTLVGEIETPGEIDYFRFEIDQPDWVTVVGAPQADVDFDGDFDGVIRLFEFSDANGNNLVDTVELDDDSLVGETFVGEIGMAYVLGSGEFVVEVSADIDENQQSELGQYALLLRRTREVILNESVLVNSESSDTDRLLTFGIAGSSVGVGLNFSIASVVDSVGNNSLGLSNAPVFLSRGDRLVVTSSGNLVVVENASQVAAVSAISVSQIDIRAAELSATRSNNADGPGIPKTYHSAATRSGSTASSLFRSDPIRPSTLRSANVYRRGGTSQLGLVEMAVDRVFEMTSDSFQQLTESLAPTWQPSKPCDAVVAALKGPAHEAVRTIESSQPSWQAARLLWRILFWTDDNATEPASVDPVEKTQPKEIQPKETQQGLDAADSQDETPTTDSILFSAAIALAQYRPWRMGRKR